MDISWGEVMGGAILAALLGIAAILRKALSKRYHSPVEKLGEKIDGLAGGINRMLEGHSVVCECVETLLINQREGKANGTTDSSIVAIGKEKETHMKYIIGRG
jgi:hypothetical protein